MVKNLKLKIAADDFITELFKLTYWPILNKDGSAAVFP